MVTIPELWIPILLAAVLVFVASSIIHMFLGYHAGDLQEVPSEARVRKALREASIPRGTMPSPAPGA